MSPENLISSAASSNSDRFITGNSSCGDSPVSCCSSNESIKVVKDSLRFIDLEVNLQFKNLEHELNFGYIFVSVCSQRK
jgi:hypothetical protein